MNKGNFNNIKIPDDLDGFIENVVETADKQKGKKRRRIKYSGTMVAGLTIAILLCISNPAIASKIPFLGDIFSFLNKDVEKIYESYLEYSTPINITKESNGIKVTIKNAIFDGRVLNFTYEIDSNRDLGEHPMLGAYSIKPVSDDGDQLEYLNENQERLEGNSYIGQATYKVNKEIDNLNIVIDWKNIVVTEDNGGGISISVSENDEVKLEGDIKEVIEGEWKFNSFDIEVKDDLGNLYESQSFGMSGNKLGWWSNKVFEKVNENASKLIITPKVTEKRWLIESNDYEGLNKYERKDVVLEPIVIELKN